MARTLSSLPSKIDSPLKIDSKQSSNQSSGSTTSVRQLHISQAITEKHQFSKKRIRQFCQGRPRRRGRGRGRGGMRP